MGVFQELHDEVFQILRDQLPDYLTYHTPEHTAHVIEKAEYISHQENVTGHDLFLIKAAALLHDIGFIQQTHNHEEIGCQMAEELLGQHGLTSEDIQKVCGMILATKIPQQPKSLLEKIVADADLEYLGTDLFYPIGQLLYSEFKHFDPLMTIHRFNEIQANFIKKHQYHTDYCIAHREAKKQKHLQEILELL